MFLFGVREKNLQCLGDEVCSGALLVAEGAEQAFVLLCCAAEGDGFLVHSAFILLYCPYTEPEMLGIMRLMIERYSNILRITF